MKACILSVSGPELTSDEAALFAEMQPWAVILMGRSCISRTQIRKLVDDIWLSLGRPCLIFIDQEGGRVARLKAPEWPVFPAMAKYGELYARDQEYGLEACHLGHYLMGLELSALGIHADCSPVVDLTIPGAHDIIGDRAFGADPEVIGRLASAAIQGLSDAGVSSVIKHIPGHGRALVDSHDELPEVIAKVDELAADFKAFQFVRTAPMAMTAHILYTDIDVNSPATTSRRVISDVIRSRIGFDGLLMSDDLGMKALGGSLGSRAELALAAGCDVVLHCSGFITDADVIFAEMREVAEHSSELSGKSLERAEMAENASCDKVKRDLEPAQHRYQLLMGTLGAAA
jgi:beta-N-acetylhexosaminidase